MPGLVGVVGDMPPEARDKLLKDMAQALKHEDWYQVQLYTDEEAGLGRVSVGILNPEPQPIWNEDHTLCIVMEGEVYNYEDEKLRLIERGHRFQVDNDPEYVLHLYEEYGKDFALKLNGAYVAAIWDSRERELLVVNDRLGLRPVYYAQLEDVLLFASGVRSLLTHPGLSRQVDVVGLAQLLTFQHLLGNRTLLTDVHLLPPACMLLHRGGGPSLRRYWTLQYATTYAPKREDDYVQEFLYCIERAVRRQMPNDGIPSAVLLTGGLDSRMVLSELMYIAPHQQIQTFTFGRPGCDDARFAREIARTLGVSHQFFELKPGFLLQCGEEGVRLTDGMKSCAQMHALATLREESRRARLLYVGFLGDSLMGDFVTRSLWASYERSDLSRMLFEMSNNVFREDQYAGLFSPGLCSQVSEAVGTSFQSALDESTSVLAADIRDRFVLCHLERRFTVMGHEIFRSQAAVRTPFCDKDLVEFMLTMPPGFRLDRQLITRALGQAFPSVAKIPRDRTGLPLVTCFRDLQIRASNQIRWWLREAGLKGVQAPGRKHYADYDGWMRTVLRPWVEETLLSKRSLERGYFNPEYIRNLVAEHMVGANHARKLGVLLSLELWHRLFLD
jgi:asparagine synthase (glutamine-hydrolysing)